MEKEARRKPPGQHGEESLRKKTTEFGEQLLEKQKLKRMYQLRESQFSDYMAEASRRKGVTGDNMTQLLEMRLDNVVYRLGWAPSRGMARQLVGHRFFTVNGKRVNIPSFQVRPGDVVGLHPSKRESTYAKTAIERVNTTSAPGWLSMDTNTYECKVVRPPEPGDVSNDVKMQLIVEFYTR
jgi:small subunit ribosomal protein S4